MNSRAVIGVDVGTTTIKVVVLDADSSVIAESASAALAMETDDSGRSEESPSQILDCVVEAIKAACGQLPDDIELVAIAVASQSGSIVSLDASGSPTGALITWMDSRSAPIVDGWLSSATAGLIRSVSGWNAGTGLGLSTLAWINAARNDPRLLALTHIGADTLVTNFLTGKITTNPSNAAAMQLMTATERDWNTQLCDLAGISVDNLPVLTDSGDIIDQITPEAAEACGLPVDLLVVAGGHDQTCAALALDVVEPGHVLLGTGTAWVVTTVAEASAYDSMPSRFNISPHVVAERITASEYLGGLGADYESWVTDTYRSSTGDRPDRAQLFAAAEADIVAGQPNGLTAISIMRRSADRVRESLEELATSHTEPTNITLVGGATASSVWPKIINEVTGLPVTIPDDSSWPAIGAARLAGTSLDLYDPPTNDAQPNQTSQEMNQ